MIRLPIRIVSALGAAGLIAGLFRGVLPPPCNPGDQAGGLSSLPTMVM
jgi:hypothetical protein